MTYLIVSSMSKLTILWEACSPKMPKINSRHKFCLFRRWGILVWIIQENLPWIIQENLPYHIEAPSAEDNHTVKSAPQAVVFTSGTIHRIGDASTSTRRQKQNHNACQSNAQPTIDFQMQLHPKEQNK